MNFSSLFLSIISHDTDQTLTKIFKQKVCLIYQSCTPGPSCCKGGLFYPLDSSLSGRFIKCVQDFLDIPIIYE